MIGDIIVKFQDKGKFTDRLQIKHRIQIFIITFVLLKFLKYPKNRSNKKCIDIELNLSEHK